MIARKQRLASRARAGLTMIEVMVSSAILAGLALVLMAANVPLSKTSSEMGLAFEMDRSAARFLAEMRRELRQSGYNYITSNINTIELFDGTPTGDSKNSDLDYRRRLSFGSSLTTNWTPTRSLRLQASTLGNFMGGTPRYHVRRTDINSVVLDHVKSLEFTLVAGTITGTFVAVDVDLTLARANPNWRGVATTARALITRNYKESIEFLNKAK
jgi:prepilin-type N-terminal cleavage/methylation domain-containing protein